MNVDLAEKPARQLQFLGKRRNPEPESGALDGEPIEQNHYGTSVVSEQNLSPSSEEVEVDERCAVERG